jgi:hypothetical protein
VAPISQALLAGPQTLEPPPCGTEGFSFIRHIQPILGRHCVRCHHLDTKPRFSDPRRQPAGRTFDPKTMRIVSPADDARWWYTFQQPPAAWTRPGFDDSSWRVGPGGFGRRGTPGARVKTPWHTPDIWMRMTFELDGCPSSPALLCHHDEDIEVYVNGVLAAKATGFTTRYVVVPMTRRGACAFKIGKNTVAVHCKQTSGGPVADLAVIDPGEKSAPAPDTPKAPPPAPGVKPAFSMRGVQFLDSRSRRKWSDSYLALANRRVANWINPQSQPSMLPPYHAGAAKSKLIDMLEQGHNGVRLSASELARFAIWIDLLVPYCGDYTEAMNDSDIPRYRHFLAKRKQWEEQEARNIADLLTPR